MRYLPCPGFLLCALILSCSFNVSSEELLLKAAHMLDVRSGEIVSPANVLIRNDRIAAINPESVAAGTRIVNLEGRTLLPGVMDMHSHVTLDFFTKDNWTTAPVKETVADWALQGVKFAREMLMAGFTTVRDAGAFPGFPDVALMRAIDRGDVAGPHMFPAGHYISITGGHCDITGFAPGIMEIGPKQGIANGKAQLLEAVRYQAKHGVKVIKVCATAGVFSKGDSPGAQQYSDEELNVIVEEANRHGLRVMAHAHGSEGILASVKAGITSIEHGSILTREIVKEMKKRGTFYVPNMYINSLPLPPETPLSTVEKNEYLKPFVEESFRMALKHNLKIAFGTDAAIMPHADARFEFKARVSRGMTPLHVLQSATTISAELLGVDDRGEIKEGLLADIIAVDNNPLEDIGVMENVSFVMKAGKIYKTPE